MSTITIGSQAAEARAVITAIASAGLDIPEDVAAERTLLQEQSTTSQVVQRDYQEALYKLRRSISFPKPL